MIARSSFVLALAMLTACAQTGPLTGGQENADLARRLTGTWTGDLPCADCEAIRTELSLRPDHTFEERTEYLGTGGGIFTSLGTYLFISDSTLVLEKARGQRVGYRVDGDRLRMLDQEGGRITGDLADHYLLAREMDATDRGAEHSVNIALVRDKMLRGVDFMASGNEPGWWSEIDLEEGITFSRMGDAEPFRTPAVEPERAQDADVMRFRATTESGTLDLQLVASDCQDNMSGEPFTNHVTVTFQGGRDTVPSTYLGCGRWIAPARLHDSWGLVRFNTDTIDPGSFGKGAPYLEFQAAEGLVMGSAGCNSITGGFTPGYRSIRFGDLASTEMWCMGEGVMDFEARFLKALSGGRFDLSFTNVELTLRHADGTELVFRRMD